MLNISTMVRKSECNKYWRKLADTTGGTLKEFTSPAGYKTYKYTTVDGNNITAGYDPKFRPIKTITESLTTAFSSVKTYLNHRKGTLKTKHFDMMD